ncbi:MAG: type II toxin-antitoxin system RelE/ParE family toxin [Candidatus Latescibacterota bacterium]|nr:MAG: type II toxin-antitoxin system RelE/ParE family toxin [Candidatus Latescibacterota bacterium]
MFYQVLLRPSARRDLDRLSDSDAERVMDALEKLKQDPRGRGTRKLKGGRNEWRLRVGAYRVLYEIDDSHRKVLIFRIRHRREAYR